MTFKEKVKAFGKSILKGLEVAFLVNEYNKAITPYQRENCAYELDLALAETDAEKEEIRKAFIAKINRRHGMPTKSNLELAQERELTSKQCPSPKSTDDFVEPPTEAYKEMQTKYSQPDKGSQNKGK